MWSGMIVHEIIICWTSVEWLKLRWVGDIYNTLVSWDWWGRGWWRIREGVWQGGGKGGERKGGMQQVGGGAASMGGTSNTSMGGVGSMHCTGYLLLPSSPLQCIWKGGHECHRSVGNTSFRFITICIAVFHITLHHTRAKNWIGWTGVKALYTCRISNHVCIPPCPCLLYFH